MTKLRDLRGAIRKQDGDVSLALPLPDGRTLTLALQKTKLLAALGEAFEGETPFALDGGVLTLAAPLTPARATAPSTAPEVAGTAPVEGGGPTIEALASRMRRNEARALTIVASGREWAANVRRDDQGWTHGGSESTLTAAIEAALSQHESKWSLGTGTVERPASEAPIPACEIATALYITASDEATAQGVKDFTFDLDAEEEPDLTTFPADGSLGDEEPDLLGEL